MPKVFIAIIVAITLLPIALLQAIAEPQRLRLSTSTSVVDSGLIDHLLDNFHQVHQIAIDVHSVGSGRALRMGRTGDADLMFVHMPLAEKRFIAEGYGMKRRTVMRNDFILAGPTDDPAGVAESDNAISAVQHIAEHAGRFVSRGDDSGTHQRERALWAEAKQDPLGALWYLETGTGTAASLAVADKESAYILVDRATFLVQQPLRLRILLEDPENLANFYSLVVVNPGVVQGVNPQAAMLFIDWLSSPQGQQLIAGFEYQGQQLFFPTLEDAVSSR